MEQNNTSSKLKNLKDEFSEIQDYLKNTNPEISDKISRIINESQIHQIELEIQNEELRSIQLELEELKNEYMQLYNNAPIGYLVLDSKAIIHKVNVCFQNYVNKSADELLGKPLNKFLSEKDVSDFLSIYDSFFKNPANKIFDYEFLTSNNNVFSGRIIGTRIKKTFFGQATDDRILLVVSDISTQKLYERKMEELVNNKSRFISTIAHDIRNPLNSMLGYSQFLQEEFRNIDEDELGEYLRNFNKSGKNLYQLIDNLLSISKLNYDGEKSNYILADQNKIIGSVIEQISELSKDKNITITFNSIGELRCKCDKFMISTVYRNILTNAIKFSNPNGEIKISTKFENNFGVIKISDNGIGISKDRINDLFDINKKEIKTGTKSEPGTGIGLLIAKDYIDKMSGEILVDSSLNRGTEITVKLLIN